MKIHRLILGLSIFLLIVTACGKQPAPTGPSSSTPIQTPKPGKVTVTGVIISKLTNKPLGTAIWLAEVVRQGDQAVYVLDETNSPAIYADENGNFVLANVDPKEYVIVVGEPEGQNEVLKDSSGKPKVWNFKADQIYDLGKVEVNLSK